MHLTYKYFKKFGLTLRQFSILFLIVFVGFFFIQLENLNETKKAAEQLEIEETHQVISRANSYFDNFLNSMREVMFVMSGRKDIFESNDNEDIIQFLKDFNHLNSNLIRTVYVRQNSGEILCSNPTMYKVRGNEAVDSLIKKWSQFQDGIWWSEPYFSNLSGRTVAFGFPVKQVYKEAEGMIVIEANIDYLYNTLQTWMPGINRSFAILSREGNTIIFDSNSPMISIEKGYYPIDIEHILLKEMADSKNGQWVFSQQNNFLMWLKSMDNTLGWQVVMVKNKDQLNENIEKIYQNFYINTLLWVILIAGSAFSLSFYFNVPIRRLATKMDNINDLDNLKEIDVKSEDEIGRLTESYNRMINRIHHLLFEIKDVEKKKKEYELKMLQSQIGPHFLYNTLTCIDSLAKQNRSDEVSLAIRSLISLLSYSFDKTSELVTLEDELNGLHAYTILQKMRYGDIFDYRTDISEEAKQNKLLKLTLQPFVENAIFHGLAPQKKRGCIKIKAFKKGEKLIIVIKDNGVGMDKNTCQNILNSAHNKKLHERFSSIGIINVNERLKINFGEQSGIRIYSKMGIGTIVRVTVAYNMIDESTGRSK